MKSGKAFTLVELLVSTGLFLVLIAVATGVFIQTLRTQRIVTNLSEDMNNASFVLEQMAREIRVGFNFNNSSGEVAQLNFTNSDGDDVSYREVGGGIERCTSNCELITSPDVEIENLRFVLNGTQRGDGLPPRVTILLTVKGEKDIRVNLQTTISSRLLDT